MTDEATTIEAPAQEPVQEPVTEPVAEPTGLAPDSPLVAKPEGGAEVEAPKEEEKPSAPETYSDFTLPEGVTIPEETLTSYKEFAKANNLSQESAQAGVELGAKLVQDQVKAITDANTAAWTQTIDGWKTAVSADPEIGGSKTKEVQTVLARALDEYGTPGVRQAFDLTGAGWNPDIIKTMYKMAKALSEGGPVSGGAATQPKGGDRASILYPTKET